jgi:hypothetical protein
MFTIPTSTVSQLMANVNQALSDAGLITVIAVAAAIPLVFYVARQLIGLVPKARGRRQ